MTASQNGWGRNVWGESLRTAKILHRAGIATALALLIAAMVGPAPAQAQSSAVYTVRDVPVDASAENAAKAREVAIALGQQEALRRLLERLTPGDVHGQLPTPDAAQVEQMVLGLSLADEKTSAVRYLAKMTVSFMPQAVQALLRQAQVPFVDEAAQPLVVLPLWRATPESQPVLWEDPNPWRTAWSGLPRGGLQPLETPLGDLEDVLAIDAARAEAADADALAAITERYGADGALIARAVLQPAADGAPARVTASADRDGETVSTVAEAQPGEELVDTLRRAAQDIRRQMETDWKVSRSGLVAAGPAETLTILAPIGSLHDWLSVRRALTEMTTVDSWSLQALTRDRAQIQVTARATPAQLAESLAPYGLRMTREEGYWLIESGAPTERQPRFYTSQGNARDLPPRGTDPAFGTTAPATAAPIQRPAPSDDATAVEPEAGATTFVGGGVTAPR